MMAPTAKDALFCFATIGFNFATYLLLCNKENQFGHKNTRYKIQEALFYVGYI